jgi:hypothetical protein
MVVRACNPSYLEAGVGRSQSESAILVKSRRLFENKPKAKRIRDLSQVVECLPGKCKALYSIPGTTKQTNK